MNDVAVVKSQTWEGQKRQSRLECGKEKKQEEIFFFSSSHAMSKFPRATPGRASVVSRFPRFPDRDHQPWEDPLGQRTAEAPPQNDQNDEALLKKNSARRRDRDRGRCSSVLSKTEAVARGPLELQWWIVMTPRGCVSASSVERRPGTDIAELAGQEELA